VAIDPNVEDFVMRLLSKEADDRPPNATVVREILERLLAGLESPSDVSAHAETRAYDAVDAEQAPKSKKAVWLAVAGVVAVAMVGVAGAVMMLNQGVKVEAAAEEVPVSVEEAAPEPEVAVEVPEEVPTPEPVVVEPVDEPTPVAVVPVKAAKKTPTVKTSEPKPDVETQAPEPIEITKKADPVAVPSTSEPVPRTKIGKALKRRRDKLKSDISKETDKAKRDAKVFESTVEGFFD